MSKGRCLLCYQREYQRVHRAESNARVKRWRANQRSTMPVIRQHHEALIQKYFGVERENENPNVSSM
jgi:hypothetical protein